MTALPVHPMAALFPMLPEVELRRLANDIKTNGQHEPVVMFDGQVLDGRNRLAACDLAGVEPRLRTLDTCPDPLAFVLSINLHRRHLNESQRAICAAKVLPILAEQAKARQVALAGTRCGDLRPNLGEGQTGKAADQAASMFDVGRGSVETAAKVLRRGTPELVATVESGEVAVSAAVELLPLPPDEQRAVLAAGPDAVKAKVKEQRDAKPKRDSKPKAPAPAPARHPLLDELDSAADRDALDRVYSKVAVASLSGADTEAAGEVYRRRLSELRAKAPAAPVETPTPPPAPPSEPAPKSAPTQADLFADDSVPVSTQAPASQPAQAAETTDEVAALRAENAAFRQWVAVLDQRSRALAPTIKGAANLDRIRRLIELAGSPSENEARNAAMLACRMIREQGVKLLSSDPTLLDDIHETNRQMLETARSLGVTL